MTHKLFVYGTLMEGYYNNYLLSQGKARKLGNAHTVEPYILSAKFIPYVHETKDATSTQLSYASRVFGELWECNTDNLLRIDRLEGHPEWYERKEIEIVLLGKDRTLHNAWMYIMPGAPSIEDSIIPSGNYKDYTRMLSRNFESIKQQHQWKR
jgi:gamma-glutamylaminecyclotransferase